jgi:hypothetical protein
MFLLLKIFRTRVLKMRSLRFAASGKSAFSVNRKLGGYFAVWPLRFSALFPRRFGTRAQIQINEHTFNAQTFLRSSNALLSGYSNQSNEFFIHIRFMFHPTSNQHCRHFGSWKVSSVCFDRDKSIDPFAGRDLDSR